MHPSESTTSTGAVLPRVELHTLADGSVVVGLVGAHDLATQERVRQALVRVRATPRVIVDLSACDYIDSTIIGVLLTARDPTASKPRPFEFVLPDDGGAVHRTMHLLGVPQIATCHTSVNAVLQQEPRQSPSPSAVPLAGA